MKRITFVILSLYISITIRAQDNTSDSVSLDILKAPSSPAFNILGISPSSIDRPTDLNALRLSIQNSSNNFTKFPSNYAVEIAPASLLKLSNQTLDKFNSATIGDVFWQTLSLSLGLTHSDVNGNETNDSTSFTKLGIGVKFSLIRPKWSKTTEGLFVNLKAKQKEFLDEVDKKNIADKEMDSVKNLIRIANKNHDENERTRLVAIWGNLNEMESQEINKRLQDENEFIELKNAAKEFKIERKGGFLDFATGMALDFPDERFNYSIVSKAGAWLTGGYEGGNNNNFSILGIARYLYQPDIIFDDDNGTVKNNNISTFDAGARLLFAGFNGKFSLSSEALYRSVLNKNTIDPSWRLIFNTEYDIGFNQKITLALGKNFDGTIIKGGNLIAALNFIAGFGSAKKISANK